MSSGEFKVWQDSFLSRIPQGGSILEIGSASGRDARYFAEKGYKVVCTDIVPQALEKLSEDVFENALRNVALVLKENGIAAFSLKTGEGEEISMEKMDAPRYFRYHTEPEIREILSKLPFEIITISHADNEKWLHVVMMVKK